MNGYTISIYISKELHDQLKRQAREKDLSLSRYIRGILKEHLQREVQMECISKLS